jgi:hypothetical protein
MIFGSGDKLAKKIKERIDELPPFSLIRKLTKVL